MSTITLTRAPRPTFDAGAVVRRARELGVTLTVRGSVVETFERFTPGDKGAYTLAEGNAGEILGMIPLRGGSVWGTDGGSVGGYVGLQGGYMHMHKSGDTGKRALDALAKALSGREV